MIKINETEIFGYREVYQCNVCESISLSLGGPSCNCSRGFTVLSICECCSTAFYGDDADENGWCLVCQEGMC